MSLLRVTLLPTTLMAKIDRDELVAQAFRMLQEAFGLSDPSTNSQDAAYALYDLLSFRPESTPECVTEDGCEEGVPLFTEAYLYPLLGKMDARTVLSLIQTLKAALGFADWPEAMSIERMVMPPFIEPEDRKPEALARGLRMGHYVEDGEGGYTVTEKGERRRERGQEPRTKSREIWGIEITSGDNAGQRIHCTGNWMTDDVVRALRLARTGYRHLLEPLEEGGEPEPLT